jgi:hypothetical protein
MKVSCDTGVSRSTISVTVGRVITAFDAAFRGLFR